MASENQALNDSLALIKQNRPAEAEHALQNLTAKNPHIPLAWSRLGFVQAGLHKNDAALASFRMAYKSGSLGNDPQPLYAYAKVAGQKGLVEDEYKAYSLILEHANVDPDHKITKNLKTGVDGESLAMVHMAIGQSYEGDAKTDAARREYEAARDLQPQLTKVRYALAFRLKRVGLKPDYVHLMQLVAADPSDSPERQHAKDFLAQLGVGAKSQRPYRPTQGVSYDANTGKWSHFGPSARK